MKIWLLTTTIGGVLLLATAQSASAGCNGYGNYGGYGGYGGYGYGYSGFARPVTAYGGHIHHNVNPWVNPGNGHYHWHDTSHLHYQPGGFVPHGNHYHYVPGRTYLHRTGHYDLHH